MMATTMLQLSEYLHYHGKFEAEELYKGRSPTRPPNPIFNACKI
jgi:hypothetical protein